MILLSIFCVCSKVAKTVLKKKHDFRKFIFNKKNNNKKSSHQFNSTNLQIQFLNSFNIVSFSKILRCLGLTHEPLQPPLKNRNGASKKGTSDENKKLTGGASDVLHSCSSFFQPVMASRNSANTSNRGRREPVKVHPNPTSFSSQLETSHAEIHRFISLAMKTGAHLTSSPRKQDSVRLKMKNSALSKCPGIYLSSNRSELRM